jgi:hypothetical protein
MMDSTEPRTQAAPVDQPFAAYSAACVLADMACALGPEGGGMLVVGEGLRLNDCIGGMRVELMDADPDALTEGVVGALPFGDGEFDCVAACDVVDQMPAEARAELLAELARVSRNHVAVLSPVSSAIAAHAEESVNEVHRATLGTAHPRVARHRQHGLPEAAELARGLGDAAGGVVSEFGATSLRSWALFEMLGCVAASFARGEMIFGRFSRQYNRRHAPHDHALPAYRALLVAAKGARIAEPAAEALAQRLGGRGETPEIRAIREMLRLLLDGYAEELPSREVRGPLSDALARVRELERTARFQERTIRKLAEELDFLKNSRDSANQQGLFRRLFTP